MEASKSILSVFSLSLLNVAAVMSLRGLPMMADTGYMMFFYIIVTSLFFLIPSALVSAELASGWPADGGVYLWVKEAFGTKTGFLAIWLQWIQNVVWYPTVLAFAASSIAYVFGLQSISNNGAYMAITITVIYWFATFISLKGLKTGSIVASIGVVVGTIIPGILIIGLGALWWILGHPAAILSEPKQFFPDFGNFGNIAFLASIVLLFSGIEVNAVHVRELNNPTKNFPKAIFIATIIIVLIFALGSFAISVILPQSQISLTAGIMEAFSEILSYYHLQWLTPVMALCLSFGALGGILAWIVGPSKGLIATAKDGQIPPFMSRINKNSAPKSMLVLQAIIVTILASLYLIMNNANVAYFLISAMTVTLYLVMYLLLFMSGIRLRYKMPEVKRMYRIPFGNFGMWLISLIGIIGVLFAFFVAFIPPKELKVGTPELYVILVASGLVVFILVPLLISKFRKDSWKS